MTPERVHLMSLRNRVAQFDLKVEVLSHYGSKCSCCGESRVEFLTIDHTHGGGEKHRRKIKIILYKWLQAHGYPKGFRVLCHNCNLSMGHYGACPHKRRVRVPDTQYQERRSEALLHYGHKCKCCGERRREFLALDHKHGGGNRHREAVGSDIAKWARRYGYPKTLRILCHNCNFSHGAYDACPHKGYSLARDIEKVRPKAETRLALGARGESNGLSKLTQKKACSIRELYSQGGWTQYQLASKYGVCQRTISLIVQGKTWKEAA